MPARLTDTQKQLIKDRLACVIEFSKDQAIFKQQIHGLQDAILGQQICKDMERFIRPFMDIFKNPNLIIDLDKCGRQDGIVLTFGEIREYLLTTINKNIIKQLKCFDITERVWDFAAINKFVDALPDNMAIYVQRISDHNILHFYHAIQSDYDDKAWSQYLQLLPWFSPEVQAAKKQQLIEFCSQGIRSNTPAVQTEYYTVQQLQTSGDLMARSVALLCKFTEADYLSVVQGTAETTNISELRRLLLELEAKGFCGIPAGMKFAFWSGQFAKNAAIRLVFAQTNGAFTDVNIPTFSFLFGLVKELNKIGKGPADYNVILALCATLASHATGIVHVYVSSDKNSECTGLKSGNYFWNVELPVLQRLRNTGQVTKIMINRYDQRSNAWLPAIDLNSSQIDLLPLYRQLPYTSQEQKNARSFNDDSTLFDADDYYRHKFGCLTIDASDRWKQDCPPRPCITIGKLKHMARRWKENAKKQAITHK